MPYVTFHKDITKVKTKLALNMTKRQLICFGIAIVIGIPAYLISRNFLDTSSAVMVMMVSMMPLFFIAMYEHDGQPIEKVLRYILVAKVVRRKTRLYRPVNLYKYLEERGGISHGIHNETVKEKSVRRRS